MKQTLYTCHIQYEAHMTQSKHTTQHHHKPGFSDLTDSRGSTSFPFLHYKATIDSPDGTPSHLLMAALIFLSTAFTKLVLISNINSSQMCFGININWRRQILNLSTNLLLLIASRQYSTDLRGGPLSYPLMRYCTLCRDLTISSNTEGIIWFINTIAAAS